jgi:hypothetical protein
MTTDTVKKWYVLRAVSGRRKRSELIEMKLPLNLQDYVYQVRISNGKSLLRSKGKSLKCSYFRFFL